MNKPAAHNKLLYIVPALPGVWGLVQAGAGRLGPDVGKALVAMAGLWAMRLLWLTLLIRPLQQRTPFALMRWRRVLGLYALGYAALHVLAYCVFYLAGDMSAFLSELAKRPYIWAGALAMLILVCLGATSTRSAQRRLRQHWRQLHRGIYPAAILVLIHYIWQMKTLQPDAWVYGFALCALLGIRLLPVRTR